MTLLEEVERLRSRCHELEQELDGTKVELDGTKERVTLLEERISGERGLGAAIKELAGQVGALRKAAWGLAGIIVTASIGFAFGVLALIGQ